MSQVDSPLRAQRKLRCARELVGPLGKDMSSPLLGAGSREVGWAGAPAPSSLIRPNITLMARF